MNLPTITIDNNTHQYKISHYTPKLLPDTIYVASENYFSTFNTPSYSPRLIVLISYYNNPHHDTNKDNPGHGRVKKDTSLGDMMRKYAKNRVYCYTCFIEDKKIYQCHAFFLEIFQR